uniref:hypothetical protein n=1 Tax=uncultured Sphingomonas sp. TaxID=158754 RepID=UPI0025DE14FF|nr:hypothetical protein [uncultured Sphingomonas sp.]
MSSAPTPPEIAADATWLTQALDPAAGLIRLVRMEREEYRAASFLDDRIFGQPREAHVLPLAAVTGALPAHARCDARWIFHIGHVGSTLIARLLGELPGVLSVREPRILRDLTVVPAEQRPALASAATALLSRSFAPGEQALVKATSFVSEIAPELVPAGERALFLFAEPRAYIAGILAGENSVKELQMLADSRTQRMAGRASLPEARRSAAHLAAAAWACEMTALERSAAAMSDRQLQWGDFDAMLADMPAALQASAGFFDFPADENRCRAIASGPLMRRYSKALEFDYSPDLRRELLDDATRRHAAAIADALAMLERAAADAPLLRSALARSNREN